MSPPPLVTFEVFVLWPVHNHFHNPWAAGVSHLNPLCDQCNPFMPCGMGSSSVEGTRGPGGRAARCERPACCCCSKERQQDAGLCQQQHHHCHTAAITPRCSATAGIQSSALGPTMGKRRGQAGEGPGKGHKGDQRCLPCEGSWRELGLLSLDERRLRGDLSTMFQRLKAGYKDGSSLLTRNHREKTRGNGHKLL